MKFQHSFHENIFQNQFQKSMLQTLQEGDSYQQTGESRNQTETDWKLGSERKREIQHSQKYQVVRYSKKVLSPVSGGNIRLLKMYYIGQLNLKVAHLKILSVCQERLCNNWKKQGENSVSEEVTLPFSDLIDITARLGRTLSLQSVLEAFLDEKSRKCKCTFEILRVQVKKATRF